MLAQELLKVYDRKVGSKRVALKVNIQKVYDTMNWQFLEDILRGFGFHSKMVDWVMKCVTTTSFSVCVNGESCGYFKGDRCLRQGDPINSVKIMRDYIEEFGKVTGLIPKYNKSTIIFGCLNNKEKQEILKVMPFKVEKLPIKYLVASVLESIHVYWAYVILLPNDVIKDINKILKDFLWNQNDGTKGRPKVAWKKVCRFKQKGGLWLKDLGVWNRAMIVKHLWHIVTDKESLWVKWVNTENLKGRSLWEVEENKNDSPLDQFINYRTMYDGRFRANMTVKEWMKPSNGMWPDGWTSKFPSLMNLQTVSLDAQAKDVIKRDSDSHSHLFFEYVYSKEFWGKALDKMGVFGSTYKWNDIVAEMLRKFNGNAINSIIKRLCFAASVYLVWQERNNRIFRDEARSTEELFKVLIDIVRMRLLTLKVKRSNAAMRIQER
ncbi:RNA-directed DNA polymerase, eukaryota, reverse transcriptase zinc-binding domain protein [Tanacetum coccineum]